jgi:hypothetical protein
MGLDWKALEEWIGKESRRIPALDRVSKSDIRHWCEVMGDPDPQYESKIRRGEKCAPPAMTMVWAMPAAEPHEKVFELLDAAGYRGAVGIGLEQEFLGAVSIGDRLSFAVRVTGVSREETLTRLGAGFLVDLAYAFYDGAGNAVSRVAYRVLKFRDLRAGAAAGKEGGA